MPPLDADKYLAWLWKQCGGKGRPMGAWEWWLAFQRGAGLSEEEGRRQIVGLAARARRRIRMRRLGWVDAGPCAWARK